MISSISKIPILIADNDKEDCYLIEKAFRENKLSNPVATVTNGEELIDYLSRRGKFSKLTVADLPCLVLLDLNMPRLDGREALRIIKNDKSLRKIPVIVMTTSHSEEDILACYLSGANSYIVKPSSFEELLKVTLSLKNYWLEVVELPPEIDSYSHD